MQRSRITHGLALALGAVLLLAWSASPALRAEDRRGPGDGTPKLGDKVRDEKPHADKRGPHEWHGPPLRRDQLEAALDVIAKVRPDLVERLEALREREPRRLSHVLQRRFPRLRHLLRLKEHDPPMYELRVEDVRLTLKSQRLAQDYQAAQRNERDDEAEQLREQLNALIERHFEVRQQINELELERLEQRIEALREQIEARADDRDDVIEQRVQELIGTEDGARW